MLYRAIILPVVLCGFLILMEEHGRRVFDNRALREIFGPKRDEVTGEWRKLHNEGLYDLYFSPNIIRVIKSRRIRYVWLVARMGDRRDACRFVVDIRKGKRQLGRLGVDGMTILKGIFKKWDGEAWTRSGSENGKRL
jgi:hypothetical protein